MNTGVIFDMDGVLVDSGPAHHRSWQILARQHGIDISAERFAGTFGRPSRDIIRIIWGADTSDEDVQRLDAEKEAAYRELITGDVPLMPGCRQVLAALQEAGCLLAVATSGPRENLELVLREAELGDYFTATVHGFDITRGKPAPDCFLLAADRIGVLPARCVVVEDAPVGVQAGVAAGMSVIALTSTHPADRLIEAGAAHAVDHLADITAELALHLLA